MFWSISIRNTDRSKIVAAVLALKFLGAKYLGIGQFYTVIDQAHSENKIPNQQFLVNTVAVAEDIVS